MVDRKMHTGPYALPLLHLSNMEPQPHAGKTTWPHFPRGHRKAVVGLRVKTQMNVEVGGEGL